MNLYCVLDGAWQHRIKSVVRPPFSGEDNGNSFSLRIGAKVFVNTNMENITTIKEQYFSYEF